MIANIRSTDSKAYKAVYTLIACVALTNFTLVTQPAVSFAQTSLIGHWKLDEQSGLVANDSSAYEFDGAYANGVTLNVDGPYPGNGVVAAKFDGADDHVDLGNLDITGSRITIAAWINPNTFSGSGSRILAKANGSGLSDNYWSLTTYYSGGKEWLAILLKTDSGGTQFIPSSTEALESGKWTHVAAVYDGATVKLYKNGEEIISSVVTGNITSGPTVPVWIAGSPSNEKYFNGTINDVRVYDIALSATEVTSLYGVVGHWAFDEGVGTAIADSTAYANDATLSGASWISDCVGKTALEFDGTGNTAQTNANFDPPSTGAVAFWMRASGTPTARQRIFGLNGNWEARQETNGFISFDLGASPYVGNEPFSTSLDVDDEDRWYHMVAMFDATNDSFEVYVNGELTASGTSPVDLVAQSAGLLSFGTRTGSTEYWEGALRDFRVYNRWLDTSEISELSGILAHWQFEETSGSVAVDASAAGNDASYVGNPVLGVNGPYVAKTGKAVELDGSSQSISTAKSLLNNLDEFSMAAWIRPDSVSPKVSILGQFDLIELGIDFQTNQLDLFTANGGSINVAGYLPIGRWTHVVAVGNGTNLAIYINGFEVMSGGSVTANYGSNSEIFKIGEGVLAATGDFFDGRVDDVHVFSRAMCPEEVWNLYKGGRPGGVRILKWIEVR